MKAIFTKRRSGIAFWVAAFSCCGTWIWVMTDHAQPVYLAAHQACNEILAEDSNSEVRMFVGIPKKPDQQSDFVIVTGAKGDSESASYSIDILDAKTGERLSVENIPADVWFDKHSWQFNRDRIVPIPELVSKQQFCPVMHFKLLGKVIPGQILIQVTTCFVPSEDATERVIRYRRNTVTINWPPRRTKR